MDDLGLVSVAAGLAFVGGLLLNLMPCVFPVLSIKILGFVQAASEASEPSQRQSRLLARDQIVNRKRLRRHGWLFGLGVLVSFWVLVGLLLALRATGRQLGWGFQLQSPGFIAVLALLMFALGLSLAGVCEIGTRLMGLAGRAGQRGGAIGTFNSGVLATVLATPCTAPFMGPAIGAALAMPALGTVAVFTALGAGMAIPYVLLSYAPGLLKRLPRPGPWMETFRQLMAFPLFATTIWLLWVFGKQRGVDGQLGLMLGMLLLAIGLWVLGHWNALVLSRARRIATRSAATLLVAGGILVSLGAAEGEPVRMATGAGDGEGVATEVDSHGVEWELYTEAGLQRHLDAGRPVFVDFTADWCITCKANERAVFSSRRVRDRVAELGLVMIKADWTNQNPEITRKLEEHGRNSVPLYLLYDGQDPNAPDVLPQILNPTIFLNALEKLETRSS